MHRGALQGRDGLIFG